jgi:hypothetical protein
MAPSFLIRVNELCSDEGNELCPEIMPLISSASFIASLYSFNHESEEDAIGLILGEKERKKTN